MLFNRMKIFYDEGEGGGDSGGGVSAPAAPTAPSAPVESVPSAPSVPFVFQEATFSDLPSEMPPPFDASMLDVPIAAPGTPVGAAPTTPVEGAAKPEGEVAPVKAEAAPTDTLAAKEPVVEAKPAELAPDLVQLLLSTAQQLGIEETDPTKIPDAIKAYNETQVQAQETQRLAAETAADENVYTKLRQGASEFVLESQGNAITNEVLSAMRSEGHNVDVAEWWKPETWENDTYGPALERRYFELYEQTKASFATRPEVVRIFDNEFAARKGEYDQSKNAITELGTKYPNHNPTLLAEFRRANPNVKLDALARVAELTHTHTASVLSKTNTELAATKAALDAANKQIAGFAKQLDDARLEGKTQIASELNQEQPSTVGLGSAAPAAKRFESMEPSFAWNSLPSS